MIRFFVFFISIYSASAQPTENYNWNKDFYRQSLNKTLPFQKRIEFAQQALTRALDMNDDSLSNLVHTQLGILYWNDGQFPQARHHLKEGQNLSRTLNNPVNLARCTHFEGLALYYLGKFDSALQFYDNAEHIYAGQNMDSSVAKIKSHKGIIYNLRGKYRLAIQNMIEAFQIQELKPNYRDLSLQMEFYSDVMAQLYYSDKLKNDMESLHYLEKKNDPERFAFTLHNIGLDYSLLKRYHEAIVYFKKSYKKYQTLNQPTLVGDLAQAHEGLGQYDSAIYFYQKWLSEIEIRGTQIHKIDTYMDIARCYQLQNRWDEALRYFNLSIGINRKLGLKKSESSNLKAVAEIFAEQKQWTDGLEAIDASLSIANELGCIKELQGGYEVKARILKGLHRSDEGMDFLVKSMALRDSILAGETEFQTAQLQIEYESGKKDRDLANLQSQNILKEEKIQVRNWQVALAFSMLVTMSIGVGFFYYRFWKDRKSKELLARQNRTIEIQNQELIIQNGEKETLLAEIHHRVKNNLQIISSLINLKQRQVSTEAKEVLQQLNGRIFSLGLIHEKLYQKKQIQKIRLDNYLVELAQHLLGQFLSTNRPIYLELDCDPIEIDGEIALSCGLICNELMTNSLKYAFTDLQESRKISLSLKNDNSFIALQVKDNGLNATTIPKNTEKSFGLRFVEQLVDQKLRGQCAFHLEGGFQVFIKFNGHG